LEKQLHGNAVSKTRNPFHEIRRKYLVPNKQIADDVFYAVVMSQLPYGSSTYDGSSE
jgi:hypothetical protein